MAAYYNIMSVDLDNVWSTQQSHLTVTEITPSSMEQFTVVCYSKIHSNTIYNKYKI